MLEEALVLAGHSVVRRAVTPGEELSADFDAAVIGLHAFASMASSRKFGAVWAATRLPHAVVFQDWKVRTTADHLHTETYLWKSSYLQGAMLRAFELSAPHAPLMDRVRARWSRRMRAVLLPMFPWADPEPFRRILRTVGEVRTWDVSPMLPDFSPASSTPPELRARAWVCASLSNVSAWVQGAGASWPVDRVFNDRKWTSGAVEWGFVPERELVSERYARSWGVMMPFYGRECVPGWWRSRPHFAAQAGAVLHADPGEGLAALDPAYSLPVREVEDMTAEQLAVLAMDQAGALLVRTATREECARQLDEAVRAGLMEPVR